MSLEAVAALLREARAAGSGAVLAHLVRVEGSHYRRPGARMLLVEDGRTAGAISGGCLEGDLLERVPAVLRGGTARSVAYDLRAPSDLAWGLGLGCDGAVTILMQPVAGDLAEHLLALERARSERRAAHVATVSAEGPGAPLGARVTLLEGAPPPIAATDGLDDGVARSLRQALEGAASRGPLALPAGGEAFLETLAPPLRLLVFGAGPDAVPLARLARALGWSVEIASPRTAAAEDVARAAGAQARSLESFGAPDRRTAAVVMSHSFTRDAESLRALAGAPPPYVGVLGPRARTERLLASLEPAELAPLRRVLRAPVGLDLGAESPEEIALAVLAEAQAAITGRDARPLSGRAGPLHERAA